MLTGSTDTKVVGKRVGHRLVLRGLVRAAVRGNHDGRRRMGRLREKLESTLAVEEASILIDRPPGGCNDLVTTQVLDVRLSALECLWPSACSRASFAFCRQSIHAR